MLTRASMTAMFLCSVVGCSLTTYQRLGGGYRPERTPRCSASWKPIVADWVAAAVAAGLAVRYAATQGSEPDQTSQDNDLNAATTSVVGALLLVASAGDGIVMHGHCTAARAAHDAWLGQQR
jgi:hypothetical protein